MKWEEIVKIQYNAMLQSTIVYIAILSAIAGFSKQLSLNNCTKIVLVFSFGLVLIQGFLVLFLINVQREALWEKENNTGGNKLEMLNNKENNVRKSVLWASLFATLSIVATAAFIIFA